MGSGLFTPYRQSLLESDGPNLDTGDIRVILIDMDDIGVGGGVTNATNATPIVITTSTAHGLATGDRVAIQGVGGNTAANGSFKITVASTTTFSLQDEDGNNIAGSGAYTSGGSVMDLELDFLNDIAAGGRVATSGALANTTVTAGVFDADDVTFTSVSGDVAEALILYNHTGTESTSDLLLFLGSDVVTGLPVTPNGGDITVQWASTLARIFRLKAAS